ncbi:MAG: mechanosensitive ion channel family protein [Smithella sp.]
MKKRKSLTVINVMESVPVKRSAYGRHKLVLRAVLLVAVFSLLTLAAMAQEPVGKAGEPQKLTTPAKEELSSAPAKVEVSPVAHDEEIVKRLQSILHATHWFTDPQVRVAEGVVFLSGQVESEEIKKWAGNLARNTQDVVAVVNRMEVLEPPVWDFRPASSGLMILWRDFIRSLPFIVFGLLILALSVGAGLLTAAGARAFLRQRIRTKLLQNVIARGAGGLIFLSGAYIILRVSGLTQLALTVVGGTGLIGLALGIAFREITENFLASIFLSMQRPFETGDLVEVSSETGYVQQLNMRTTILMTLDGNLVQIPNASVYKSNLRNFTTNSNRREDFVVGIGYDDAINDAQEIVQKVLADHPAVLNDPEPSVLADSLGRSTVNLRVYFWLNGREHSWLKVRSSVIRLVKRAFQKHGISMPDEAREVVFPQGVPVTVLEGKPADARGAMPGKRLPLHEELDEVSTKAEAGLYSEAVVIEEQARQVQPLKDGENLLPVASSTATSEKKTKEPKP